MKIEEIAPYLPYGVKMIFEKSGKIIALHGLQCVGSANLSYADYERHYDSTIWNFKLILHPLSDLTKPCLPNGNIPIDFFDIYEEDNFEYTDIKTYRLIESISKNNIIHDIKWLPYGVVEKLFEWHFDVFDLIEKGEAVDVNTLNL